MIRIPKIKFVNDGTYVCMPRTEFASYAADTDEATFKALNTSFDVTLNGNICEVRECRVSAMPYNRPWPGKQRQYNQSESAGFISFSADESVTVKVKSKKTFASAQIRPKSKNIVTEINDGEVVFTLEKPGNYVLELDDEHNVLHIFFNPIKEYKDAEKSTYFFGPGLHYPGIIYLRDNDTVYIDENAIVFGSINTLGAKNVKIFGGGVVDNSCEERVTENAYENHAKGNFRIYNSENIEISDVIFTNSCTWAMSMFNCSNIRIDNVKIVGHWKYNTDGIDIVNSDNVSISNSFIRSFDDTITIKAVYDYQKPVENITVDNCVMWCGWGKNCEIGIETAGIEYKNITFKNCDLVHNMVAAFAISNGNHADMHDICFENINVELQYEMTAQLQTEDGKTYDVGNNKTTVPLLVKNSNEQYAIRQKTPVGIVRKKSEKWGNIHNVVYRNINIITEGENINPSVVIESHNSEVKFDNFLFDNVYVDGKKQTDFDGFYTRFANADNIVIK